MMLIKGWKMENKFVNFQCVERDVVEKNVKKVEERGIDYERTGSVFADCGCRACQIFKKNFNFSK